MTVTTNTAVPFEEALDKTGNGLYNILLACTCAVILLAVGMDLFGFSVVITAACDLNITVSQKGILTSLPFMSFLLTSYFWGYVSDTRGRRFTLILSLTVGCALSIICSVCNHWLLLGLVKFLSVCFSCSAQSVTYTLLGESCVQRVRSKYMLLMTCMLMMAPAVAAAIAYPVLMANIAFVVPWLDLVITPWRLLLIVLALPSAFGALGVYFCYESPKFLANADRDDEALEVLKRIYEINHKFSCSHYDIYGVTSFTLHERTSKKESSFFSSLYEQSAILFRPPLLWRTIQLFYIVAIVYSTNNSFLFWLPHILNIQNNSKVGNTSNVCALISTVTKDDSKEKSTLSSESQLSSKWNRYENETVFATNESDVVEVSPNTCTGRIEQNVIFTLIASQFLFTFLNFIISYLPNRRKTVLIVVLCLSSLSGVMVNLIPEVISSVMFYVLFTGTCLGVGILSSYFVDLYPTSHRGMVSSLSVMVGRTSSFFGINIVGNVIFTNCQITFYLTSLLILTSLVAAWFLPPDKTVTKIESTNL